jgi:hypothetical protein
MEYLEPDTEYEFQVAIVTDEGSTAYSETELIKTPAEEIETPPDALFGDRKNNLVVDQETVQGQENPEDFKMRWQAPEIVNKPILFYLVYYKPIGTDDFRVRRIDETTIAFTDLKPSTEYEFSISVVNDFGEGPDVKVLTFTTQKRSDSLALADLDTLKSSHVVFSALFNASVAVFVVAMIGLTIGMMACLMKSKYGKIVNKAPTGGDAISSQPGNTASPRDDAA